MVKQKKTYQKKFTADLDNLEEVRSFVRSKIREAGLKIDNETEMNILLAVDEAFTNAVIHGCKKDSGKKIQVRLEMNDKKIKISVKDPGKGFKPKKIRRDEVIRRIKALKRGGLGLYLIYSYMDQVYFMPKQGLKNQIVMIKKL